MTTRRQLNALHFHSGVLGDELFFVAMLIMPLANGGTLLGMRCSLHHSSNWFHNDRKATCRVRPISASRSKTPPRRWAAGPKLRPCSASCRMREKWKPSTSQRELMPLPFGAMMSSWLYMWLSHWANGRNAAMNEKIGFTFDATHLWQQLLCC